MSFPVIAIESLAGVSGGRQSSSSTAEIKTLLQSTADAVKDLARQKTSGSSSDSMMPMMMLMMMKR